MSDRLRDADAVVLEWVSGRPDRQPVRSAQRWDRLRRRPRWRWVPTLAIYIGAGWIAFLGIAVLVTGPELVSVARGLIGFLLLESPAFGRPPLSLRRLGIAVGVWWLITLLLLPLFGLGLVFAPSAIVATVGYVTARIAARPRDAVIVERSPESSR